MIFLQDYIWFLGAILLCMAFSLYANAKVKKAYAFYGAIGIRSGLSGKEIAIRLLRAADIHDVSVGCVKGELTDHYHPRDEIVNLSDGTYNGRSIAAAGVAAHEIGHVVQKKKGSALYYLRAVLVPVVRFGSGLGFPLVFIGILLDSFVFAAQGSPLGFYIAIGGVALYGSSLLFTLVTLPVELDASRRAGQMLLAEGILTESEVAGAKQVLSAAALTYLASLLTSLVYFLRFLLYVLAVFGKRSDR